MTAVHLKTINADGVDIFYREAGLSDAPTLLLLHGFPSSSHQYRNLIPLLSKKYHILAPDIPGFGFTTVPESLNYKYTFDALTTSIESFLRELKVQKYSIYLFNYGGPIGLRLAIRQPDAIQSIISQNGNAYTEGLGGFWAPLEQMWATKTPEELASSRESLKGVISLDFTKWQYVTGTPETNLHKIAPESYTLDYALISRPGNTEIQLDLFYDYRTNIDLYPEFQKFFRESNVPILAVWGKNDEIFVPAGAEGFKKDSKNVVVEYLDAGHFALETNVEEITDAILRFKEKFGL
ncbi:putative hydrolase or acyltransferase of alpha beta superfamily protein [Botrytis fragariae]|uniref:Putative hydrolase or acyltransferase of alpha beta superfamily protein n=1 Tax=Botrytis fragariae TaxID=1964551 RepID=A0A8H6AN00_9HELO|nr:putative hydrolase or acyltransferase of alpha beta superfamily protein [Botrytis fragariae]KAF5870517.1 putative hydrolase or acyltransferase of alpha beta superfamily protein [Botrytis fragariae]